MTTAAGCRFDELVRALATGAISRRTILGRGLLCGGPALLSLIGVTSRLRANHPRPQCGSNAPACGDTCCSPADECLPNLSLEATDTDRICCPPDAIFVDELDPTDAACCPAEAVSRDPAGQFPDVCCDPRSFRPRADGFCCAVEDACGDRCCPIGEVCACGACAVADRPCDDGCCAGDVCLPQLESDAPICCPPGRVCDGQCCSPGLVCQDGVCGFPSRTIRIRRA